MKRFALVACLALIGCGSGSTSATPTLAEKARCSHGDVLTAYQPLIKRGCERIPVCFKEAVGGPQIERSAKDCSDNDPVGKLTITAPPYGGHEPHRLRFNVGGRWYSAKNVAHRKWTFKLTRRNSTLEIGYGDVRLRWTI